ncbi:MAG: hypothetical protein WEC14_08235 [Chloroflexota bacterium]
MATTDAKPGFRLPWSSGHAEATNPVTDGAVDGLDPQDVADVPGASAQSPEEAETQAMIDTATTTAPPDVAEIAEVAADTGTAEPGPVQVAPATLAPARKPNKFMADLTRAMQAAAESARSETLERMAAEAKTFVESIHAASSDQATELRRKADDDVAAVREWSKVEIARIRDETEERIAHRKERLEREIEDHAAAIETRIERVQRRVAAFETEMEAFFERLLAENDPTRFAAMAESLPEPPPLDADDGAVETMAAAAAEPIIESVADVVVEPPSESIVADLPEVAAGDIPDAEATPDPTPEPSDPRLSALALAPDFAAAEAEAADFTVVDDGSVEEVPEIADEAITARLAGLVPDEHDVAATAITRLSVVGLVSVASIAGFKRHLSHAPGVQSVGVSSGPDGEFVFAVTHDAAIVMRDIVPVLPGFGARVTGETDGELTVSAQDPESEG